MQKRFSLMILSLLVAANGTVRGEGAVSLEGRVVESTLPNGMKLLLLRRPGTPVFSANITFRVGGVDEQPGLTGIAHFYEHLAFKGTRTMGVRRYRRERSLLRRIDEIATELAREMAKGEKADQTKIAQLRKQTKDLETEAQRFVVSEELWDLYVRNGASGLNATTGKDVTNYYVSLPANRLELWAWLESDRMLHPVLREFYSERDVVCEERLLRVDTQPDGRLYHDFIATAFIAHPARYPVIGFMSDIRTITRPQAEEFGRRHYVPANATVSLVGDIDVEQCNRIVRRYFGRFPARPLPPPIQTQEPEQRGERRLVLEWDANPQLIIGFHKPSPLHADEQVFEVIAEILSRGRTSRLYKTLVRDRRIATMAVAFMEPTDRYPNLFGVWAIPLHPHTTREVEQAIYEVMNTLITDPPGGEELQKIRNNLRADFLRRLQSNRGMASTLGYYQAVYGEWRLIEKRLERIDRVTADEIRRVAQTYFTATNRTVGEIVRVAAPQPKEQKGQ